MKYLKTYLLLSSLFISSLSGGCGYTGIWDVTAGYRHDSLDWSLAGPSGQPDTRAQIDWKNIHSVQLGTRAILAGWDTLYVRGEGYGGWILQQDARYRVYDEDHRQGLVVDEQACRGGDQVFGGKGGLGIHLLPCAKAYDVAFLVGYSFQKMRLRYRSPKLLYSETLTDFSSVDNLLVQYRPVWNGGFVAVDGMFKVRTCLLFTAQYELHYTTYRAKGRWMYEQPSLEVPPGEAQQFYDQCWKDCSNGWGQVCTITASYNTNDNWYIGAFATVQHFRTRKGEFDLVLDKKQIDADKNLVVNLPNDTDNLNRVRWVSYYIGIDLQCRF